MCEMMHCFYWRRNWWIWNSFVSSLIPHWRCSKQTPVEGALLCWSFNLLSIFQPRSVSFPFFLHFQAKPRWEKIIDDQKLLHPFLDSPLTEPQTDFCGESSATVKLYICSCFLAQVWLFCLLQFFDAETGRVSFHIVWNYYIPSCIPPLIEP